MSRLCLGARRADDGSAGGLFRRLPGLPRRHHRQRRLPVHPGLVPRVRRSARCPGCSTPTTSSSRPSSSSAAGSPTCSAGAGPSSAGVALFTVASALVRRRAVARAAGRRPRRAGARCRPAGARVARPGRRGVPGRAAGARHRPVGRDRGRRGRARSADRRRPGRARRLALGLPGQHPVRPRGVWSPRRSQLVESRAPGRRRMPDLRRRRAAGGRPGAAQPGHHQGQRLGLGQRRRARLVRRRGRALAACSSSARGGTARRCSTPRCCASRSFTHRLGRDGRWPGSASTPTCSPTSSGCSTSGATACCGPAWRWCPVRWSPRSSPPGSGPLADRYGYRVVRRARRPGLGRRLPLVPPAGRARAGVLDRVAARPGAQRHRRRRHPSAAGQRGARRRARAAATPPRRRWCPAPASSAACSGSRSWS